MASRRSRQRRDKRAVRRRDAINKIAVRLMCENPSWSSARAMDRAKIEYLKGRLE